MPRIEQPLTQIHFLPPQLFLVNVGDMTYGHYNAVISAASSTPFRVVVQPEKGANLCSARYLLCGTNVLPYSAIPKIISSMRSPLEITSILEERLQRAMLSNG